MTQPTSIWVVLQELLEGSRIRLQSKVWLPDNRYLTIVCSSSCQTFRQCHQPNTVTNGKILYFTCPWLDPLNRAPELEALLLLQACSTSMETKISTPVQNTGCHWAIHPYSISDVPPLLSTEIPGATTESSPVDRQQYSRMSNTHTQNHPANHGGPHFT